MSLAIPQPSDAQALRLHLHDRYTAVRRLTQSLCQSLTPEDMVVQTMDDVSPTKWHLAHTTWFFEEFVLGELSAPYEPVSPHYAFLFNSYYEAVGERWARPRRGHLTRPSVAEVMAYRDTVDQRMERVFREVSEETFTLIAPRIELGLNHEQQHQELLCTDIKYTLGLNPLFPAAFGAREPETGLPAPFHWMTFDGGLTRFGAEAGESDSESGFCFDNERPVHEAFVHPFALGTRPVTNGEYLAFIEAGGYSEPRLWLSEGIAAVRESGWGAPLHWHQRDGAWFEYTLHGLQPLNPHAAVCHLSGFEADAYARWREARLPTEYELELAAGLSDPAKGHFLTQTSRVHPTAGSEETKAGVLTQVYGDVWEWTRSAYSAYPGFAPLPGALGEYNAKFMCNQLVLRGGSCATPAGHLRPTYRNFFPPHARWQFSGLRLARDLMD